MLDQQFLSRFGPVIEGWASEQFKRSVLERIAFHTADFTSNEMKELCELILDNCDRRPSISKVLELSRLIKKRRIQNQEDEPEYQIKCEKCIDVGVIKIDSHEDDFSTLMHCDCSEGRKSTWKLPQWISDCGQLFKRSPVPVEWFSCQNKPNVNSIFNDRRVEMWRSKIKIAEMYWESNKQN